MTKGRQTKKKVKLRVKNTRRTFSDLKWFWYFHVCCIKNATDLDAWGIEGKLWSRSMSKQNYHFCKIRNSTRHDYIISRKLEHLGRNQYFFYILQEHEAHDRKRRKIISAMLKDTWKSTTSNLGIISTENVKKTWVWFYGASTQWSIFVYNLVCAQKDSILIDAKLD